MQTFSDMRRNRTDQESLKLIFLALVVVFGQIMSSLYPWIPPFSGLFFCYILLYFHEEGRVLPLSLAFAYLIFFDINWGFFIFSYVVLFMVFYHFALAKIRDVTTCANCILATYVVVGYIGHYFLNCLFSYFSNQAFPYFSNHYFYYIAIDSLLAFLLFSRIPR